MSGDKSKEKKKAGANGADARALGNPAGGNGTTPLLDSSKPEAYAIARRNAFSAAVSAASLQPEDPDHHKKLDAKTYEAELHTLQVELVKLQEWVRHSGLRVAVVFEGRDAAGKGGTIKRITEHLNPRVVRIAALAKPNDRENTEWYFQRYIAELPAGGEIVLFDRSWYNRAGVERVMGYCTEDEVWDFFRACPELERMLIRSGLILVKYWFSVSDEEQERRFRARVKDPLKQWKLSPIDLESRLRWVEYSQAKDEMFSYTDTKDSPWWVVNADDKRRARLNVIRHLLSLVPYGDVTPKGVSLKERPADRGYVRPPMDSQTFVPEVY